LAASAEFTVLNTTTLLECARRRSSPPSPPPTVSKRTWKEHGTEIGLPDRTRESKGTSIMKKWRHDEGDTEQRATEEDPRFLSGGAIAVGKSEAMNPARAAGVLWMTEEARCCQTVMLEAASVTGGRVVVSCRMKSLRSSAADRVSG
jgi:hypothetical protein